MKRLKNIIYAIALIGLVSCTENFFDFTPDTSIPNEQVFTSFITAESSLIGAYSTLGAYSFGGLYDPIISDLMGEDIKLLDGALNYGWFKDVYQMSLLPNYQWVESPWIVAYAVIYGTNNLIVNAYQIEDADEDDVKRLVAEAKALRAYCLLHLSHLYCNAYGQGSDGLGLMLPIVPAGLKDNDVPRSSLLETYKFIETDLLSAESTYHLVDSVEVISNKSRMNVKAVQALLARTYLDMEQWEDARDYAKKAVDHKEIELQATALRVYEAYNGFGNANINAETLFGIAYTTETSNVYLSLPAFYFPVGGYSSVRTTETFYNLFEKSDARYDYFLTEGSTFYDDYVKFYDLKDSVNIMIVKFGHYGGTGVSDRIDIRASEMYLIEAECEARLTNTKEAREALSVIQSNAYGSNVISKKDGDALLDEILLERRKELFGEGFRLSDIKRNQQTVVRDPLDHWYAFTYAPGDADYYKFVMPIPQSELESNKEISSADQNTGY